MRNHLAVAGAVFLVVLASPASAEFCVDFDPFCDGLELTRTGDLLTGTWRNYNCAGSDAAVVGLVRDLPDLPCHPGTSKDADDPQWPGKAFVGCMFEFGCEIFGDEWWVVFDRKDGTADLGNATGDGQDPPGACWFDEIHYDILPGPCPFKPLGGVSSITAVAGWRQRLGVTTPPE